MKASSVYFKTMKFVWLKLALGAAVLAFALISMVICFLLGSIGNGGGMGIAIFVWAILVGLANALVNRYFGYLVKAGHVAMVATVVTTGTVPANQFQVATAMVKERFATANVYIVVDKLVGGAVRQLQKAVGKIGGLLENIPGMSAIVDFLQMFIGIALGYVDECCLGYTFLHKDQSAYKSAADGVVIYFQNWKKLLKDALFTTLIVIGLSVAAWLLPFLMFWGIFGLFGMEMGWLFALILGIFVSAMIKSAFIDSYMMVKMMVSYMQVAPTTEITFDLYGKLCKLSNKFKSLFDKGQAEQPAYATATAAAAPVAPVAPVEAPVVTPVSNMAPTDPTNPQV